MPHSVMFSARTPPDYVRNNGMSRKAYLAEKYAREGLLAGRTALVTGAASGIGRALVNRLYNFSKASIYAVDCDKDGLAELKAALPLARVTPIVCDLTSSGDRSDLPHDVDVLINCAGVLRLERFDRYPDGLLQYVLDLMLAAPMELTRLTLPHMYDAGWGRVIHISSTMGVTAQPYKAAYVAAKHGLEGFSKVIALEGAPFGVTSNTVRLAHARTPLASTQIVDEAALYGHDVDTYMDRVMFAPLARKALLDPVHIARFVESLWLPFSDGITGEALSMTNGWLAS